MFREMSARDRKYGTFDQVLMSFESPQQNRFIFTCVAGQSFSVQKIERRTLDVELAACLPSVIRAGAIFFP